MGGGVPSNFGVLLWGTKSAQLEIVVHIAGLLGTLAPAQATSVRFRGFPVSLALAVHNYAQLRRFTSEAFGRDVAIRAQHCTQEAHNSSAWTLRACLRTGRVRAFGHLWNILNRLVINVHTLLIVHMLEGLTMEVSELFWVAAIASSLSLSLSLSLSSSLSGAHDTCQPDRI